MILNLEEPLLLLSKHHIRDVRLWEVSALQFLSHVNNLLPWPILDIQMCVLQLSTKLPIRLVYPVPDQKPSTIHIIHTIVHYFTPQPPLSPNPTPLI